MPDLQWVLSTEPPPPTCGLTRGKRGRVRCELPPDHVVGRNTLPYTCTFHTGRNVLGRWLSWPMTEEAPSA